MKKATWSARWTFAVFVVLGGAGSASAAGNRAGSQDARGVTLNRRVVFSAL